MTKPKSILALEENSRDVYLESSEVLLRVARNILKEPSNPKYRSISLGSNVVTTKLLTASGAIECLFEMGFQEGSDKLILPQSSSLDSVKKIHDELLRGREHCLAKKQSTSTSSSSSPSPSTSTKETKASPSLTPSESSKITQELFQLMRNATNPFFKRILIISKDVLQYEDKKVQLKALECIPLVEINTNVEKNVRKIQLAIKKKEVEDEVIDFQELLLIELLDWFKNKFFKWVNSPECIKCNSHDTKYVGSSSKPVEGASRVELYKCSSCQAETAFPRYDNVEKLLETRKGRCGEWANCFSLFCRSLGWETRKVVDETDHVWTEVFSYTKQRWVHCDPCENVLNAPLMYECGWNKKLSYVLAYSRDGVQDVTWRYSCNHKEVLKNRKNCREEDLVALILNIRNVMLNDVSAVRRNYVIKRTALELVEFLKQGSPTDAEKQGRSSGSLAWRLARGEIKSDDKFSPYVWKLGDDVNNMKYVLCYFTSKDEYEIGGKGKKIKGWNNGLYQLNSISRKEEKDWKMVYLARTEGSEKGTLSWKFETEDKYRIDKIELKFQTDTFHSSANILCKLCAGDSCVRIPNGNKIFSTDAFSGCKSVELMADLSGGEGNQAWQHTQLFRQSLNTEEAGFVVIINLKPA